MVVNSSLSKRRDSGFYNIYPYDPPPYAPPLMVDRSVYIKWYGLGIWKRLRKRQLQKEPLCHMCKAEGYVVAATVANHTVAHKGDWDLFVDPNNLDSLCKLHHDRDQQSFEKTGRRKMRFDDDGWPIEEEVIELAPPKELFFPELRPSAIHLTILYGPAASGKTTYCNKHKSENDIIIDMERIKSRLFGQERGGDWSQIRKALRHRNDILNSLSNRPSNSKYNAWFLTTCQTPAALKHWERVLKPKEVKLIKAAPETLFKRVSEDAYRLKEEENQKNIIVEWFEAWGYKSELPEELLAKRVKK